jgi:hypothetical protein
MILFCDGICLIAGFSQIEKKNRIKQFNILIGNTKKAYFYIKPIKAWNAFCNFLIILYFELAPTN